MLSQFQVYSKVIQLYRCLFFSHIGYYIILSSVPSTIVQVLIGYLFYICYCVCQQRRQQQPTPVFLPGESQGWGSLVGCCLQGRTELDMTKVTQQQQCVCQTQALNSPSQHFLLITINLFLTSVILFLFLINNLKMSNSVGFIACTMLYNYHIYLIPKHLLHPKETSYSLNSHSPFSTPLAPRNHYLLPVYMELLILDISYTWNYMISSLLCLASLSYSDVLEVHTLCSMYRHTKKSCQEKDILQIFHFQQQYTYSFSFKNKDDQHHQSSGKYKSKPQ